jgi:Ca2+-binding RTX toxin-like protein
MSRLARRPARIALVATTFALLLGVAATATNVVPSSRAGSAAGPRPTANQLKPEACAALDLTEVSTGSGGGNQNTLILGSAGSDVLVGASGNDCIVGGAGTDLLIGNAGTDVCIGGPGIDVLHRSCETRIQ